MGLAVRTNQCQKDLVTRGSLRFTAGAEEAHVELCLHSELIHTWAVAASGLVYLHHSPHKASRTTSQSQHHSSRD